MRRGRLVLYTVALGASGALAARLFELILNFCQTVLLEKLAGYQMPVLTGKGALLPEHVGPQGLWLVPLALIIGGLLAGILIYTFAPEAEGHGTDTVVDSFHNHGGFLRARVPPLKMVASAITIGSGGSAGREGPTALINAGMASVFATWTRHSDDERRLLVLIGMAAGLSAIFRSPVGTAIFAVEVLYSDAEIENGAPIYTMLAAVVAYTVNGLFVGWHPLFNVSPEVPSPQFVEYFWYAALGVAAGLIATALPVVFYRVRDLFRAWGVPPHIKPAAGALGVGLIALGLPAVLGGGYGWMQMAIQGQLSSGRMLLLAFAKIVALALTISSGGSGGVFAPSMFVGTMLGGAMAGVLGLSHASFAVVGMAAVFAGAARVPIATMLMVTEMTGSYNLLVAAALAVTLSFGIQSKLSARLKYHSLYEAQLPTRASSPAHRFEQLAEVLRRLVGRRFVVPESVSDDELLQLLISGTPIDLPTGKQLAVIDVEPASWQIGKSPAEVVAAARDQQLVVVLRGDRALLPHPDSRLQAGDRLLVVIPKDRAPRSEGGTLSTERP